MLPDLEPPLARHPPILLPPRQPQSQHPSQTLLAPLLIPQMRNRSTSVPDSTAMSDTICVPLDSALPFVVLISRTFQLTRTIPRSIQCSQDNADVTVLRKSTDGLALSVRAHRFISNTKIDFDGRDRGEDKVMFQHRPFAFNGSSNMTFYMSPFAISELASGLCMRSRPACVIMNMSVPRWFEFDDMDWSEDSLRMLNTPNAGGSSLLSEVLSCEVLGRCLGARLARTEMEIKYLFAYQPITDYTVTLPNVPSRMHVGVSVTRAFAFQGAYRKADCRKLLKKKLTGILASSKNVLGERFFKQILHVWVPNGKVARTVQATYRSLPFEVTRNTVVLISVVNARWVFSNRRR
ncbi:hypothetical protein BGZ83_006838 [Gryganskiella cystojenkinii]|nr:hypothetical protein BGZ83_006838 [Gryganskiella cystojenkinii]